MIRSIFTFILVAGIAMSGAAQKSTLNPDYRSTGGALKVVIIPYFSGGSDSTNSVFVQAFDKGRFSVADTEEITNKILNNELFNHSLQKTYGRDFDRKTLKRNPNLYAGLTAEEIRNFKANVLDADILIIGSELVGEKVSKVNGSGNMYLSGEILAFDLKSGDFILQCSDRVKSKHEKISPYTPYPLEELVESLYACFEKNMK